MAYEVNKQPMTEQELHQRLLRKLSDIFSEIEWMEEAPPPNGVCDQRYNDLVCFHVESGEPLTLAIDVKSNLRPSTFELWVMKRQLIVPKAGAIPVLAVPLMSDRLVELCRSKRVSWYDLAGNCWIDVPGQIHIERRGLPPIYTPPRPRANLASAKAGRVIRVLLSPAHAKRTWTHRGLVKETVWKSQDDEDHSSDDMVDGQLLGQEQSVSLALVNKVLQHLRDEGFIEASERKGIRVRDPRGLLEAWNAAYRFDRHRRLNYFTLLKANELEQAVNKLRILTGGLVVHASFSAAERQAPHVRQARTWLYVAPHCLGNFEDFAKAEAVDSGENIIVLVPDDLGVLINYVGRSPNETGPLPTDPVQTYVDLRHSGGRGDEAAQAILEQVLLPAWKMGGIA